MTGPRWLPAASALVLAVLVAWARVGDYQCSAVYDLLGAGVVVAGWWVASRAGGL